MSVDNPNEKDSRLQSLRFDAETTTALVGTVFSALLLLLTAVNAGPLWRDEMNTLNLARMPSLKELWQNMPFESFPPLWPLIVRGCSELRLADSDAGVRVLGIYVGAAVLISFWLTARWMGCRAPILSIGLLGSLPAFIFIMGANRAYGLASCLLVFSHGTVWRMLERPSRARVLIAAITCFLFVHCVYYDAVFLAAILAGGAAVTLRRRQWKILAALTGIGAVSAISLAVYLPIIHAGSAYVPLMQWPAFGFNTLWTKLCEALTARSSGEYGSHGQEIWLWMALLLVGIAAAVGVQRENALRSPEAAAPLAGEQKRADLALYCVTSMLIGVAGLMAFLYRLHYWTQSWYYIEMLCLWGISLDGLLGVNWPKLRPWGALRIGLMVLLMVWYGKAGWEEAHTRRSNVDLIAAALGKNTTPEDLIVVQTAFEGITFNHYYRGQTPWMTVPPVDSHLVHRNDLVVNTMHDPASLTPVLQAIKNTLQSGHNVWLLGTVTQQRLDQVPANLPSTWLGTYLIFWNSQISMTLLDHATKGKMVDIFAGGPVCYQEDLPVMRFSGFRDTSTNSDTPAH